jgi:hypothetical protein
MSAPNMRICIWCRNKTVDVCLGKCQAEGRYRYLEPDVLESWEPGPFLPPFRELVELPAHERLAILYLSAYYSQQE